MTSTEREKIIALAKEYSYSYGKDSASLTFANIIDIWELAQREAYEKAAAMLDTMESEWYDGDQFRPNLPGDCADEIRSLKEQS